MSDTGAHAAPSPAEAKAHITIAALEDVLYEMLAVGLDPCESRVTQNQIQQFLFEHARSPKSREEFLKFFQAHGLPTDPESEAQPVALDPVPGGAGQLPRQPSPVPRRPRLDLDGEPVAPVASAPLPALLPESLASFEPELAFPENRSRTALFSMGAAVAALLLLLGAVAAVGYSHLLSLQQELAQTRAEQARDRQAFERVDQQISALGTRTANTGNVLADMEYKLDRVAEAVSPEPEP